MRRPEPLDPAVARELADLDAALAGGPAADPSLVALVQDVRAVAPRPTAAARADLDARVAAGFPPPARRSRLRRTAGAAARAASARRDALVPALGVAAAALVALVVVLGARGGPSDGAPGTSGGGAAGSGAATQLDAPESRRSREAPGPAAPPVAPVPTGPADRSAPAAPVPTPAPSVAPAPGRRVERTVRLELGTGATRFETVTDAVIRTTQRAGGFVAGSQVSRDGRRGTATYVLRVPATRLDAAITALSRLAHVRSIEQATQDLTGAHDATAARLRDERTRRRALVVALATASGDEAARLRTRLATASARVRRLEREQRALRSRTAYATVDLTVTATRASAAAPARGDRWTPADAWRAALRGLEVAAGVLIILAAFAVPLALVVIPAVLAAGSVRRRRRETALDTA